MAIVPAGPMSEIDGAELLHALQALRRGDFSARLPMDWPGMGGRIADTFNEIVDDERAAGLELARSAGWSARRARSTSGPTLGGVTGRLAASASAAVNALIDDLVQPTSEMARVIGAVAKGDLSQTMALEVDGRPLEGEFLRTAKTVNTMVDQLGSFASEVTRVAREVGTEGKLGGQAKVQGRRRHLEGPDRQRELDGRQPDRPGAQHRRGDHRRGQRRPVQEDHRRRQGRDPRAEEHHQHDGGPARARSPRK